MIYFFLWMLLFPLLVAGVRVLNEQALSYEFAPKAIRAEAIFYTLVYLLTACLLYL